jgi:predicted NAD/FAD-binding protein
MRIAVVGTGISGMVSAWLLTHGGHQVTVFEAGPYIGGHTNTLPIEVDGHVYPIDTGFIVFNDRTYPNFIRLLAHLGVPARPTTMSFSVRDDATGLEWNGANLDTLFAQRRNLLRPAFWRMVRDILRFGREAPRLLGMDHDRTTLGDYLAQHRYSREFAEWYLYPMGGAIWSAPAAAMPTFPARFFVRFFHHHGMLTVDDRPQWRTVAGGSGRYIAPLTASFRQHIRLDSPVERIARDGAGVRLSSRHGEERFAAVVIAAHADQALRMLADPTVAEQDVVGAFGYQPNLAILHTDETLMPRRRKAWAAWNYHRIADPAAPVPVTYNMNILQGLAAPCQFLVTLNHETGIDPAKVLRRIRYRHPEYTVAAVAAQRRRGEVNGINRTWFCGAYWGNGFHEDGVVSALAVARDFGIDLPPAGCETALTGSGAA